jgi:hypothetical protein
MEHVHGIAVAGGTFPATIWKLFMQRALGGAPVREFPEPSSEPEWKPFEDAQYALGYSLPHSSRRAPPASTTTSR